MRVDQHDRPHRLPPAPHADRPRPTTPPPNNPPPPAFTTIPLQLVAKLRKDVESREQELAAFQEKYKIRMRDGDGGDGGGAPAAAPGGGGGPGVLVG